jgi:hypothetical protein
MPLAVLLLAVTLPPPAPPDEPVINEASELVEPCRREAEAHFVGRGLATYQWTASHSSKGQTLQVAARLRVEGRDVPVACRIARGARLAYMTVELPDD